MPQVSHGIWAILYDRNSGMKKKNHINRNRESVRLSSTPDLDRDLFRLSCNFRRRGKRIEEKKEEGWVLKELFERVNAAKRYVRSEKLKCYAEG
jgi:hypothetical protein